MTSVQTPDYEVLEYLLRKIKAHGLQSFSKEELSTLIRGQQEVIVALQSEIEAFSQVPPPKTTASIYDTMIQSDCIGSFHTH